MEGIHALGGPPSFVKQLIHLAGQMALRLAMIFMIVVVAFAVSLPTMIRQCIMYPTATGMPLIWQWSNLKPASRIERWLWIIASILGLTNWFCWSQADQISGHYIANGKRVGLTIKQGEVIELPMPCTLQLGGDLFEVRIRRSNNELRWVEPPGHSALLKGIRQTRYAIRVTRLGLFKRKTIEAVVYAKPPN